MRKAQRAKVHPRLLSGERESLPEATGAGEPLRLQREAEARAPLPVPVHVQERVLPEPWRELRAVISTALVPRAAEPEAADMTEITAAIIRTA